MVLGLGVDKQHCKHTKEPDFTWAWGRRLKPERVVVKAGGLRCKQSGHIRNIPYLGFRVMDGFRAFRVRLMIYSCLPIARNIPYFPIV